VLNIGDQFMVGPSLLINPVYNYQQRTRELYLPKGQGWYDLYSGKYYEGGQKINAAAPYDRIPVFVKGGSILPVGPDLQYTDEKPADTITLYVYTGRNASFSLYEDENTNYNYEKGVFSQIPIKYNETGKTLTIGDRQGSFPGMLRERSFRVVWITPGRPGALEFDKNDGKQVLYSGKAVTIKQD
jgi:alpha-D-xyloside xylohydrolase